ncbi:MAG TPA: SUMF1/EgtB/PvdO family nonheme iron enzyme [bacterium]|nr:SUMF1/EgtB/PvdO family nonheme iron enzyme [bacterium]
MVDLDTASSDNTNDTVIPDTDNSSDTEMMDDDKDDVVIDNSLPDVFDSDVQSDDCIFDNEKPDYDSVWQADEYIVECGLSPTGKGGAMCLVPEGIFVMGCDLGPVFSACASYEQPAHSITLKAFYIDQFEVTLGQYQSCIDDGACNNNTVGQEHYWEDCDVPPESGKENHPMNCVSWYGAKAYCEWVGKRLPTEAEWEKAARGTDGRMYTTGMDVPTCDDGVFVEYYDAYCKGAVSCFPSGGVPLGSFPVGSKPQGVSPYGAYDMAGNVWEWVNDWFGGDYSTSPFNDPQGPETGTTKILRGGSFSERSNYRASTYIRLSYPPDTAIIYSHFGFRCAY